MSNRTGLGFILVAACALVWIGFPPDTFAQQRQQGLVANVVRPMHPILIRNQHGPLLRVIIDVAPGQAARLVSMEFSLDGTDDLTDIEAIQLFGTGNEEAFSPATPIGEAASPAQAITVLVDRPLSEGRNVFWLSCRLKDTADLRHQVSASCKSFATSLGDIVLHSAT
jgi:hypothetical protein